MTPPKGWILKSFQIVPPDDAILDDSEDVLPPTDEEPHVIKPLPISSTIVLHGEVDKALWWVLLSKEQLSYKLAPGWNRRIWGER
jgi:hypothetical protein